MRKKKSNEKSKEQVGETKIPASEMPPEEIYAGCEKWFKIIHSLNLPEEVFDDDDAFDAAMKERGYS